MGSHHPLGGSAALGLKMFHFVLKKIALQISKQAALHPGPVLPPVTNALKILQACIYKYVNTGLFWKSPLAPSIVKLNVVMIDS